MAIRTMNAINDDIYDDILTILSNKTKPVAKHKMDSKEKRIYNVLRKGVTCKIAWNPVKKTKENRLNIQHQIIPRSSEVNAIISFFYNSYKGEGARKLYARIKSHFTSIGTKTIQKWLNENEKHFKLNPIFNNKPPLNPVVSHTVQGRNQIDLVDLKGCPVAVDCQSHKYVLSVLDVFSRFVQLRALRSKESSEVVKHLKDIFR